MIAIVVLNYNDWVTTKRFVETIKDYRSLDKIIVVDNCSTDESLQKLKPLASSKIDVVCSESNKGYAAGNNVGIRFVRNNYPDIDKIVISNPDIHIIDVDICRICEQLDNGYALSTGLIYTYNPETKTKKLASNFGWKVPQYRDLLTDEFLLIYKIRRVLLKTSHYLNYSDHSTDEIISTECVPGCFFAIKMEALNKIGDFDENTFLYNEENILGWQLKNLGYKCCIVRDSEVLHECSKSINKSIKSRSIKKKYCNDGSVYYIKNYLGYGRIKVRLFLLAAWLGDWIRYVVWKK